MQWDMVNNNIKNYLVDNIRNLLTLFHLECTQLEAHFTCKGNILLQQTASEGRLEMGVSANYEFKNILILNSA